MTNTGKEKLDSCNDFLVSSDAELSNTEYDMQTGLNHRKKTVSGLFRVLVTILITSAMLIFSAYSPAIDKAFAETTPSQTPVDYYKTIEKSNLDKQIDAITKLYGSYLDNYKKTAKGVGSEVTVRAEFDQSIAVSMGLKGLKSIKATILSMQTDKKSKSIISLFTNDNEFTKLSLLTDTEKELVYILIPELSKAYLKITTNGQYGESSQTALPFTAKEITALLNDNPLTESLLNKLLKKYAALMVSEIDNAYLSNDTVTAGGVTGDYTKASTKLDEKTILAIAEKILTAAKTDKDLINLCEKFKICTKVEYKNGIQDALDNITDSKTNLRGLSGEKNDLIMSIWVDNAGNIVGRDFSYDYDSQTSFLGYKITKKNSDVGFDAWYTSDTKEEYKIEGKLGIGEDKGYSGDVNLSYKGVDTITPAVLNLKLVDVKYDFTNSGSYINGMFTLTGDSMSGLSVIVNCTGNEKQQSVKIDFTQGVKNLVSVMIDSAIKEYKDFNLPTKTAKVYDAETQMEDYISSADFVKYLEDINKKINVEGINNYIEQLLYAY